MKKLTILVMVMLVATLFVGCWVSPEFKLDYIEVEPNDVTLDTKELAEISERLEVTAHYGFGTYADVTSDCNYISSNTKVVTVSDEGLVVGVKPEGLTLSSIGKATILVTYTQHNISTGMRVRTAEVKVKVKY